MPLPHNLQPHQTVGIAKNLGLVELQGVGEYAIYGHPQVPEMITLVRRHGALLAIDLLEQMEKIGITREEVETAYDRLA